MFWSTGVLTSLVAQSVGLAIGIAFSLEVIALINQLKIVNYTSKHDCIYAALDI